MGILHGAGPRVFPLFTARGTAATPGQGPGALPFGTWPTAHIFGGHWIPPGVIR
jgi:hypothetical protein